MTAQLQKYESQIAELRQTLGNIQSVEIVLREQSEQQEKEVEALQSERVALLEDRAGLQKLNDDLKREIIYLERQQSDQSRQLDRLLAVTEQLGKDIENRQQTIDKLSIEKESMQFASRQSEQELTQLKQAYQSRLLELTELETAFASRSSEAQQLQTELVELKEETQLMLRPARSPVNRYVVEIHYSKDQSGSNFITYILPGEEALQELIELGWRQCSKY